MRLFELVTRPRTDNRREINVISFSITKLSNENEHRLADMISGKAV